MTETTKPSPRRLLPALRAARANRRSHRYCGAGLLLALLLSPAASQATKGSASPAAEEPGARPGPQPLPLRLNQIQLIGTHNSYHVAPLIGPRHWRYTMPPLERQLDELGVRVLELDVHHEPSEGFTVHHLDSVDEETTCRLLTDCLGAIRRWSDGHPGHGLIYVMLELKDVVDPATLPGQYADLEQTILTVWPRERLFVPDELRGDAATLGEAIRKQGWPTLDRTRDRVAFLLIGKPRVIEPYTRGCPSLEGRLLFVLASPGDSYAAFVELAHPIRQAEQIRAAVEQGFIVRTRADADCQEAATGDRRRAEAALQSGAHLISTDFPEPGEEFDYSFALPGGKPSRCNPLTALPGCVPAGY